MRKFLTLIIALLIIQNAKSDVDHIAPAYQYTLLNYSIKGVYSYEVAKSKRNALLFSGGIGLVTPFFNFFEPTFGTEFLVEKRMYFKKESYQGFSISGYIGVEHTLRLSEDINDFAVIPGLKLNFKGYNMADDLFVEPYLGLSCPVTVNIYGGFYYPFPLATLGLRVGLTKLNLNRVKK